jgi:hypothetical protein
MAHVGVARQQRHFLCGDKAHWFNIRVGSKRKLGAALGMSCSRIAGGKCQWYERLAVYISPVIPEALVDLYASGCCCFFVYYAFCCKRSHSGRPASTGPDSLAASSLNSYEN